ncbi:MAG: Uma2 family endonuclease [Alphaproteobacteria bacterium]
MRATLEPPMTVEQFFAWLEDKPDRPRYELIAGEPVEMSPERVRHAKVKLEVCLALRQAIERAGLPYTALTDGVAVRVDDHTAFEPDASVAAEESLDDDSVLVPEPVIVVEVLSPSTAMRDASIKLEDYFRVPTIDHYLIVDPERRVVFHHRRIGPKIETEIFREGRLVLDPPGIDVEVGAFFR